MREYGFVYCVMGPERNTNRAGHVCLVLYCTDDSGKKMVTRTVGFYAMPPHSFLDQIFNYDISGNHGWLKPERLGDFDAGYRMRGIDRVLPKEKFEELDRRCYRMEYEQDEAVFEHARVLDLKPMTAKHRHHAYEQDSLVIYELEKERAIILGVPSRLKPFELLPPKLNNCKFQVLDLLKDIIPLPEIKHFEGSLSAIPRSSGKLNSVFFNAVGRLHPHTKKNRGCCGFFKKKDEIVYYREQADEEARLSVMTCPQDDTTIQLIERLKRIEKLLEIPTIEHPKMYLLLGYIQDCYQALAYSESNKSLYNAKYNAKGLLDAFYAAAIGEFEIEEYILSADLPFFVIPDLTEAIQKKLCDILEKPYIKVAAEGDHLAPVAKFKRS